MQPLHDSRHHGQQMLVSSPRCILNCQQLKIHLPPLPESRDSAPKGQYLVSPPMSASSVHSRFSNAPQQHLTYGRKHSDSSKSGRSNSGKHSPAGSQGNVSTKSRHHDPQGSLGTPTSASVKTSQSSRTSVQSSSGVSALRDDPNDDSQDSPEGQSFTAGAPGVARRQKAHVPSACVNCKRKHLACETKRPCNRCVQTGKEASCVDVQHKKRGRPRLREEDNLREAAFGREYVHAEDYATRSGVITVPQPGRPRSKSYRELRSQPEAPYDQRPKTSDPGFGVGHHVHGHAAAVAPLFLSGNIPTVLLTSDLLVTQHNHAFAQALQLPFNARGHSLTDLVVQSEREKIFRLQSVLRAELLDAARLPPMHGRYDPQAPVPAIENLDIARATAGFQTRSEYWTFRLPKEQSRGFPISISLAQAGAHFIVLTLIQRSDSSKVVLSPNVGNAIHNPQMLSPLSPSSNSPILDRQSSKAHTNGTPLRYFPNPSYTEHVPVVSPTYNTLNLQPSHRLSVGQYSQRSPPRSVELPYTGTRQSSSPEQLRNPRSHHDEVNDIPRHLQLPPIRTSGSGISDSRREDRGGRSGNGSPVKGSPQSGRKKKRRRVGIEEMLH